MLLDQVPSDLHHRVEGTLQDLLRPIADQLARRLCHFLFVRLDQLSQLRLDTQRGGNVSGAPLSRGGRAVVQSCKRLAAD